MSKPKYWVAKYPGVCSWCSQKILAGKDTIMENPATHGMSEKRYIHLVCWEKHQKQKPEPVEDKQGKLF